MNAWSSKVTNDDNEPSEVISDLISFPLIPVKFSTRNQVASIVEGAEELSYPTGDI